MVPFYLILIRNLHSIEKMVVTHEMEYHAYGNDYKAYQGYPNFFRDVVDARPFVFEQELIEKTQTDRLGKHLRDIPNEVAPLDMPFPFVWFEGGPNFGMMCFDDGPDDDHQMIISGYGIRENLLSEERIEYSVLTWTYQPQRELNDGKLPHTMLLWENVSFEGDKFIGTRLASEIISQARKLLEMFRGLEFCTARYNEKIKIGSGSSKRLVNVPDIIHVSLSKRQLRDRIAVMGKCDIDWSHRWEVMGHWRRCIGNGKDRLGNYVVPGWTWVIPHVRGPITKPIKRQLRMVEA